MSISQSKSRANMLCTTPATENTTLDKMEVSATCVKDVLQGVAHALKASENLTRSLLAELSERVEPEWRSDMLMDDPRTCVGSICRPFHEWYSVLNPAKFKSDTASLAGVTLAITLIRESSRRNKVLDTETLDKVLALISEAIMTSGTGGVQFIVSRSAQGFLFIPLYSVITTDGRIDELWRLHCWLNDGKRGISEEVTIHAHPPFGQSWILLGEGINCSYEVDEPIDPRKTTHAIYTLAYQGDDGTDHRSGYTTHQQKSTIVNTGHHVRANEIGRERLRRDESYCVPAGSYHSSTIPGTELHATIFVFDARRGFDPKAAVLGPKEEQKYEQLRDPEGTTAKELVQIINQARKAEQEREAMSRQDEDIVAGLA